MLDCIHGHREKLTSRFEPRGRLGQAAQIVPLLFLAHPSPEYRARHAVASSTLGMRTFVATVPLMARALWSGSLSFGLVNIPIEIHTAVKDKGPHFRMLRKKDKSRIHFQRVAEKDGEVVEWEDIVKGYEYAKGQFIVLTPEDFEKAALKKDRIIDIQDFVQSDAVDDRYFDKPYYLLPGKGGDKAYALLREAIKASGRMGIAKFVLRSKQRLAGIEAIGDALVLSTMRFRDELAKLEEYDFPAAKAVQKKQLQLAERLIEEFASDWEPEKYTDDYRHNIM